MTHEPRDETLARRFAELRRADAEKAPPFASMWRPAPSPHARISAWWIAAPALSMVAAAAAFVLWVGVQSSEQPAQPASVAAVATASNPELAVVEISEPLPLDFLLSQPSLAAIPDFGSTAAHGVERP